MKTIFHCLISLLVILLFCVSAPADIIHLKNGGRVRGIVVSENQKNVTIDIGGGTVTHDRKDITAIDKEPVKSRPIIGRTVQFTPIEAKPKRNVFSFFDDIINTCGYIFRLDFLKVKTRE